MLYNYLITAVRNFRKNRFYTLVNVFGLSIGITCCLVVFTILKHELTFDGFHDKSDQIFRIVEHFAGEEGMSYNGVLPNALGFNLDENTSLIEDIIVMHGPMSGSIEFDFNQKHHVFKEGNDILFADQSFLKHLNFPVKQGAEFTILNEPFKVFITEKIAEKYYGNENPIGEFITFDERVTLEIVGVLYDTPTNTNVPFEILISFPTILEWNGNYISNWDAYWAGSAYAIVNPADDRRLLEKEINEYVLPHLSEYKRERSSFYLQPLNEVHTDNRYEYAVNYVPPKEIFYGLVFLAVITLVASILNFINLATAQAVQRSREVGVRKTLGGTKSQLRSQFFMETIIISLVAMLLAFTIGQVFIKEINNYLTMIAFEIGYDSSTILFAIILCIIVAFLGGFYPGLIISSYNPITALHHQISLKKGSGNLSFRRALVVTQFVVANLLIITTIIVSSQMQFIQTKDLGFDVENTIILEFPERMKDDIPTIRDEFLNQSFVERATWCTSPPQSHFNWNSGYTISGKVPNERMQSYIKFIDDQYLHTYEIPIIRGRNISNRYNSDTTYQLVVNREFLKRAGVPLDSAIGLKVTTMGTRKGIIQGVVEDFHMSGLQSPMSPIMMTYSPGNMNQINLKLKEDKYQAYLSQIEEVFRKFGPNEYLHIRFLDDLISENYVVENLVYTIFQTFAGMAIFIGIIGLYGMVSFMAINNKKNISIRKIFGAPIAKILLQFSREYLIMIFISFVLAAPIGLWVSTQWLSNFAYKIEIVPAYFVYAFLLLTLITLVTIGHKTFKVATNNPADSLRHE